MTVVIVLRFDAADIGLERPLARFSESRVESERTTATARREGPLPYLWVWSERLDPLVERLAAAPALDEITLLDEYENRALCRTRWSTPAERRLTSLLSVVRDAGGTALQIRAYDSTWEVRVRFDDRKALDGLSLDAFQNRPSIGRIHDARDGDRNLLTDQQHETLTDAYESGYFDLPRRTSVSDMADAADISLNAASERLRRATHSIVEWYMSEPTRHVDGETDRRTDDDETAEPSRN